MTEQDRKLIKDYLQRGDLKEICRQFGKHSSYPAKVLSGQVKNIDFLEALLNKAISNKTRKTAMEKLKSIGA